MKLKYSLNRSIEPLCLTLFFPALAPPQRDQQLRAGRRLQFGQLQVRRDLLLRRFVQFSQ